MYKATNIDTDKALAAIEEFRRIKHSERQKELYGIEKYYEGIEKGLERAESLFKCSNYEKDETQIDESAHTKIQYNYREYTISGFCERMAELERRLNVEKMKGEEDE